MSSVESPGLAAEQPKLRGVQGEPRSESKPRSRPTPADVPHRRAGLSFPAVSSLTDIVALAGAMVTAKLAAPSAGGAGTPILWLAIFPALVLALAYLRGTYRQGLRLQILDSVRAIGVVVAIATVAVIALRVITTDNAATASQTLRAGAFAVVYLAAARAGLIWGQRQARKTGRAARRTLIVGAGHVGTHAARRLLDHPEFGLRPVGFLDKNPLDGESVDLPVLGASWDLEQVIQQKRIEHVVVSFSTAPHHVLLRIVERCEELGISVSLVPRLFEKVTGRINVEHLGGLPLLEIRRPNPAGIRAVF